MIIIAMPLVRKRGLIKFV